MVQKLITTKNKIKYFRSKGILQDCILSLKIKKENLKDKIRKIKK